MKIHIVQKGDTLWEISKKYGVDFQELKAVNTQLSNPDMIMPGMKIKVPTGTVHVKKEAQIGGAKKEAQINVAPKEEQIQHPFAEIAPQPFPVIDFEEEVPEIEEEVKGVETGPYIPQMPQMIVMPQMPVAQPQMPVMPQTPQYQPLEIDINNFNLMGLGMPQIPTPPTNVLPGMMAPEEDFELEEDFEAEMPQMPQMQQMPQMPLQQPAMFNNCVPITPVMPGYGFNYVPGFQGGLPPQQGPFNPMGGFPPQQGPFNQMGGFPRTEGVKEEVKEEMAPVQMAPVQMPPQYPFEIDINNFNIMQAQMPQMVAGVEDEFEDVPEMQQMPQMAPMQAPPLPMGPCVPVTPVMPGYGFNGGFPGPAGFGPNMPMQAAPQAVSPAMANNPGPGFVGPMNPQMMPSQFYNKKDCGCGGPKPPFAGHFPQQGYPMGQPGFQGQFQPPFQPQFQGGGFPGYQGAPFGMNPNQQMPFNPMFNMPDVDDDLDD